MEEVRVEAVVDDVLVRDVARVLVSHTAPDELPAFDLVSAAYLSRRRRRWWPRRRDEPLAFGVESVITLLTPVAITVATQVLTDLAGEAVRAAGHRGVAGARRLLRQLLHAKPSDATDSTADEPDFDRLAQTVSDEQWIRLREEAYRVGLAHGLPETLARQLAEAIGSEVPAALSEDEGRVGPAPIARPDKDHVD
jgi:hypothetical protein